MICPQKKKTDTMGKKEKEKTSCQKKKKDWTKMGTIKSFDFSKSRHKITTVDLRPFTIVVQLVTSTIFVLYSNGRNR